MFPQSKTSHHGIAELIERISVAFADVKRDGGVTWHEAEGLDCHLTGLELEAERSCDNEESWQDISAQLFKDLPICAVFLDARGLRYYLPAFMVADLRRGGNWNSAIDESIIEELAVRVEFPKSLTPDQRRAVRDWLRIVWQRHPWYEPEAVKIWERLTV